MTLIGLIVFVIIIGIILNFAPIEGNMAKLVYGLIALLVVLVLLSMFGLVSFGGSFGPIFVR